MKLYHTSPKQISQPEAGLFGDFLCFAESPYTMTASAEVFTYALDFQGKEIEASRIFYDERAELVRSYLAEIERRLGVDAETAENLLDETLSVYDLEDLEADDLAEISWEIQRLTAEAGRALGYDATVVSDEQGACWMISAQYAIENGWKLV